MNHYSTPHEAVELTLEALGAATAHTLILALRGTPFPPERIMDALADLVNEGIVEIVETEPGVPDGSQGDLLWRLA